MRTHTPFRPTWMEVSQSTLKENARLIKARLGGRARMMAVVKADAYGHGALEAARCFLEGGADQLAVALVEEGITLREGGIRCPILVLGGATPQGARAAVARNLTLTLYDGELLEPMHQEALRLDTVAHAHVKLDTGMGRVGVMAGKELAALLEKRSRYPRVKWEGAYTHFAAAGQDEEYTRFQNGRFLAGIEQLREAGCNPIAHAAASDAIMGSPELWHHMVRPGIALYGASVRDKLPGLKPAQQLVTRPLWLKWIEKGDTVGYGRTFRAQRPTLIATLPVGYGDGYPRLLSGKAQALVQGKRVPLVGRICMDMMMADVTEVPGITREDQVVLMGSQGDETITPDELADLADTIPYEIMLGFGARVPRFYGP